MDNPPEYPAFHSLPTIVEHGPTPASTCSEPPEPRSTPPVILELISQLGLRYQPSAQADMQAHGARVMLLAADMADANPLKLRHAIARWVAAKPFLPKASELRAIIDDIRARESEMGAEGLEAWCEERNVWAKSIGADWWYRVCTRTVDGIRQFYVEKLEGWRAIEQRAHAERKPIQWYKPTPEDAAAIHSYAAQCVAEGMTQEQFNTHLRKTGGCPRV